MCLLRTVLIVVIIACISATPAYAQNPGKSCEGLAKAIAVLDEKCLCAESLSERANKRNAFLAIQKQLDILGCENVGVYESFCGGLLNPETTYIDVTPASSTLLNIGDKVQLNAKILGKKCADSGPGCKCTELLPELSALEGGVVWYAPEPGIAIVGRESGLVIATGDGLTQIFAYAKDFPEVSGGAFIQVGNPCNDEAFILLEPVFTVAKCGESFTYKATVMVYNPTLDTYLPSDCHGNGFCLRVLPSHRLRLCKH